MYSVDYFINGHAYTGYYYDIPTREDKSYTCDFIQDVLEGDRVVYIGSTDIIDVDNWPLQPEFMND